MESSTLFCSFKSCCFYVILLSFFSNSKSSLYPNYGNETDRLALLAFKERIIHDPLGALSSWNNSSHFCTWKGVTCSRQHGRVITLNLKSQSLGGTLSPHISNLTSLKGINLRYNNFTGEIPQEFGLLIQLQHLNLSNNILGGEIPFNLSYCSKLTNLDLGCNELVGRIPAELGVLSKLVGLGLFHNHLSGIIPSSFSNFSTLVQLSLTENCLGGNIPEDLGHLSQLELIQISVNMLTGTIPSRLFNISSLYYFAVADNQLHGSIPSYVGLTLPNVQKLLLGKNDFSGHLPHTISNSSVLQHLDFSLNHFSGQIPTNLGHLPALQRLNIGRNQLGNGGADDVSFLNSLVNCTRLEILALNENHLRGQLPVSISNLSQKLTHLYMGANRISGNIPAGVENLVSLISLAMEDNLLKGGIPDSIGRLPKLQELSLFGNNFTGEIPSSIGNITLLTELNLDGTNLRGSIPTTLGNCRSLKLLKLSGNKLSGLIPKSVHGLSSLSELDLSRNFLNSNLPIEVGSLINLQYLIISDNELSGEILSTLENCLILESLILGGNFFQGTIPLSLSSLKGLQDLDLSRNNLSGPVPAYLVAFKYLQSLNLSSNHLEGEIPVGGIFKNASAFSVLRNKKLCGGIPQLHLPTCISQSNKNKRRKIHLRTVLFVTGEIVCVVLFIIFVALLRRKKARNEMSPYSLEHIFARISYNDLLKATNGFSVANLVGVGSYGSVYKGILGETIVAVKVLDLQRRGASRSFTTECEALRNIRHRNLVKVLTSCSSIDFEGEDFKALIFEFMSNGNLDSWLHPSLDDPRQSRSLTFEERLKIAMDVANAVNYLHHQCYTPIVHCDLKPSNILLDDDMNGHVGDFGISRFLSPPINSSLENETSSASIKGSVGYVAPEYGIGGDVWTHGDVYSYGILLLEMFLGKRPTDDMFRDGLSLHSFAEKALVDGELNIITPTLLQEGEYEQDMSTDTENLKASLIRIIRLAVYCSFESPRERMEMSKVVAELQEIKDMLFQV